MSDDTTRWVIIAGGDGYQTATVTGVAAMELAFLRAHEPDATLENPGDFGKSLLEHIRDPDQWSTGWRGDRTHCEIRHEDGWVQVYRLTDDLVGIATPGAVLTSEDSPAAESSGPRGLRSAPDWAREFRNWAYHIRLPDSVFVPVHPDTLRAVADILAGDKAAPGSPFDAALGWLREYLRPGAVPPTAAERRAVQQLLDKHWIDPFPEERK